MIEVYNLVLVELATSSEEHGLMIISQKLGNPAIICSNSWCDPLQS
jgi:hypothetical protein